MFKSIITAVVLVAATSTASFASQWSDIRDDFRSFGFEKPVAAARSVGLLDFVNSTTPRSAERMEAWEEVVEVLAENAEEAAIEAGLTIGAQGVHLDIRFIEMAIEGFTAAQIDIAFETANANKSTSAVKNTRSDGVIGLISVGPAGPTFGSI